MTGAEAKYRVVLTKEDPWTFNLEGDGSSCSSNGASNEDVSVQRSSTSREF